MILALSLLFPAELIGAAIHRLLHPVGSEFLEENLRGIAVDLEPFCTRLSVDLFHSLQIVVEIMVGKILSGAVLIYGIVLPAQLPADARRVGLLLDALYHILFFCVSDFRPAFMVGDARRLIGVDHGNDTPEGLNLHCHYTISFIKL